MKKYYQADLFHTQEELELMRKVRSLGDGYAYKDPKTGKIYTNKDLQKLRNKIKGDNYE